MIIVPEFLGRLANNLFQVAAAIGYAKRHNIQFAIPGDYHHKEIYEYFPNLTIYKGDHRSLPVYDTANDTGFAYKEIPKHEGDFRIRGFWQSVKYFEHCQDEVRSILKLKETPIEYVALHIRRGDYVKYSNLFPPVTIKYISDSIKIFYDKGYSDFLVFSDDIHYCVSTLHKSFPHINFQYSNGNAYEDLSLIASCEHGVIANSSFSLYAAWYNRNSNKIVVSPSKETWFGKSNKLDASTLIPKQWIQIHAR